MICRTEYGFYSPEKVLQIYRQIQEKFPEEIFPEGYTGKV